MTKKKLRTVKVRSYRKRGHKIVKKGSVRVKKYMRVKSTKRTAHRRRKAYLMPGIKMFG